MYGTIARMRVKPGMEEKLRERLQQYTTLNIPGFIGEYMYRMDRDASELYLAVMFESKDSYFANANSPEQNTRYEELLQLLEGPPEWNDGEVIFTTQPAAAL